MEAAWIGVIGTLLGGVVVGLFAFFSKRQELNHQVNQELRKHVRLKREELHLRLSIYQDQLGDFALNVTKFAKDESNMKASKEEWALITRQVTEPMSYLSSLQRLYAPSIRPTFKGVLIQCGEMLDYGKHYVEKSISLNDLQDRLLSTNRLVTEVQRELEALIHKDLPSDTELQVIAE